MKAFILANIENKTASRGLVKGRRKQLDEAMRQALEFEVLTKINQLKEVEEAYLLFGEWDMLIKVNGIQDPEKLASFVMNKIRKIPEIRLTSTMVVAQ